MRIPLLALTLVMSLTLAFTPLSAQADNHTPPGSFADLAEKLLPAVVNISSTQKVEANIQMPEMRDMPQFPPGSPFEEFFEEFQQRRGPNMQDEPEASLGSGFVIDAEKGYIITNNHVIRDAEEVRVTFHDDVTLDAEIIGTDEKTDIAVLQVKTDKKLTAVDFGDSDVLRVGDWVLAIGNPFGLGGTVTAGIISARQRDIHAGPYDDFLQTDASINRGNSGGPMFNLNGEVIGINTAIFSPTGGSIGIGFAIPSALANPVINQLIEYGRTRRGWLGVRIQQVTDEIAESLGLEKATGALVASVTAEGPSEAAGLKIGDIILELNGKEVKEMRELPRLVAETPIDTKAKVTYWRDGKRQTTEVKIGELEKAEEDGLLEALSSITQTPDEKTGTDIAPLGITLSAINDDLRKHYGISLNVEGLVITNIEQRSEASKKGLFEGDVIVEINQAAVKTPTDVQNAVTEAQDKKRNSVLLLINRDGDSRFMALKLDDAKNKDK
jgi:serine protease Do